MIRKGAAGSGGSVVVETCQVCDSKQLDPIFFAGYLPPVNTMPLIGTRPAEQPAYPAQLLSCATCSLVQLGLVVDPAILFPPSYPYTSGSTAILRENFAEMYRELMSMFPMGTNDLAVDIGSNDGTLLGNFKTGGHRVHGIEPTDAGLFAKERGIDTLVSFFNAGAVAHVVAAQQSKAQVVTATNVFAHIEDIHEVMRALLDLLADDGIFMNESHYWLALVETLQYDTIYHEHLRHYTLASLQFLLQMHGLEVLHAKRIPTHGGSMRVYAARAGKHKVQPSVSAMLAAEERGLAMSSVAGFRQGVLDAKLGLHALLRDIKAKGQRVYGIGAPSRASTLINYVGLDDGILDCVLEIKGSYKIGRYIPGTVIPVLEESKLLQDQPEYALLLSWHIADELMAKLTASGFTGNFLLPLPEPHVVPGAT